MRKLFLILIALLFLISSAAIVQCQAKASTAKIEQKPDVPLNMLKDRIAEPSTTPSWSLILQALLTPVIGILAVIIAWQQWRTAHNKFRLDYFQHRYPIYKAMMILAVGISERGTVDDDELQAFAKNTRGIDFFFNEEINKYGRELYKEALAINMGHKKIHQGPSSEKEKSQELLQQRVAWFIKQVDEIPKKFRPYLKVIG